VAIKHTNSEHLNLSLTKNPRRKNILERLREVGELLELHGSLSERRASIEMDLTPGYAKKILTLFAFAYPRLAYWNGEKLVATVELLTKVARELKDVNGKDREREAGIDRKNTKGVCASCSLWSRGRCKRTGEPMDWDEPACMLLQLSREAKRRLKVEKKRFLERVEEL